MHLLDSSIVCFQVGRRSFGAFGRFRSAATGSSVREFGSGEYVCPMTSSKTMTQHRKALESKMQLAEVKKEEGRGNSPSVPEVGSMKAQWGVSLAYQPGSDELNFVIGPTFKKQCTTIFPA